MNTKQGQTTPRSMWENPWYFIACGFGSGWLRPGPGTWGTLIAIPFWCLFANVPLAIYSIILLITFIFGCWICHITAQAWNVHDHPSIVWDELVGYWITMFALPKTWIWVILGFIAFRIFDIWKPWPIRFFDRKVPGGIGIMLDDVIAAIFACILLHVIQLI